MASSVICASASLRELLSVCNTAASNFDKLATREAAERKERKKNERHPAVVNPGWLQTRGMRPTTKFQARGMEKAPVG